MLGWGLLENFEKKAMVKVCILKRFLVLLFLLKDHVSYPSF